MTGGNKRRLSRGGSAKDLLGKQHVDSEEEDSDMDLMDDHNDKRESAQSISGNNSNRGGSRGGSSGRRRSSFGGARFANAEEQARVVGMYTNIIKLSSENKINDKNSWNLDLIDNMGKLLKDDSRQQRGVNFQKASCTLDASVKIYSHRVDDTYSTSHRVLESFSRNQLAEDEEEEDEGEEVDGTKTKKAARVGSRKRAGGAATTIEKNIDNINAKEIENEAKIDPIFQTMSKLFDKGGVHGMLMYNLRCTPHTSGMALSADGLIDPLSGLPAGGGSIETEEISLAALKEQFLGTAPAPEKKEQEAVVTTATTTTDGVAMDVELESSIASATESAGESSATADVPVKEDTLADLIDISVWVRELGLEAKEMADMTISPQFDAWRGDISAADSRVGLLNPLDFATYMSSENGEKEDTDAADMKMNVEEGDEEEKNGSTEKQSATVEAALECMRSSSALQRGFYDVSCLSFEGMTDSARAHAKMRRETALLSATSSCSSTMYDVMAGRSVSLGSSTSEPSPLEDALGFCPETREYCIKEQEEGRSGHYDSPPLCHDADGDDTMDDAPFDQFGDIENEVDDCDDEGNYISSVRRASMQAPPISLSLSQQSQESGLRRSVLSGAPISSLSPCKNSTGGGESSTAPVSGKIDWAAVNGEAQLTSDDLVGNLHEDEERAEAMIDGLAAVASAAATGVTGAEYAYFDVETVAKNNNWAGAKHWKWGAAKAKAVSDRVLREQNKDNAATAAAADADDDNMEKEEGMEIATSRKAEAKKGSKQGAGKAKPGLDFYECLEIRTWDDESIFAPPKSTRSDTTCMTAAALEKLIAEAETGELFLPKDEKIEARDMCRLFTKPSMIVPPVLLRDLVIPKSMSSSGGASSRKAKFARDRNETGGSGDVVWSMGAPTATTHSGRNSSTTGEGVADDVEFGDAEDYDDVDYDDDRFYGEGGTDVAPDVGAIASELRQQQGHDHEEHASEEGAIKLPRDGDPAAVMTTAHGNNTAKKRSVFDIDESKLIQLDRKVEKINIGYSVVPKKVNVKQLKVDIWDQVATLAGVSREGISSNAHGDDENDDENEPPPQDFHATHSSKQFAKTSETTMSFQSLVNTVAKSQKQKEVTLSFYFICLLHLANEKTLKITDNKDTLDELIVSGDAEGRGAVQ